MSEILLYVPHSTSRLQYILHWIFVERYGIDVDITTSMQEFETSALPRINYSNQFLSHCINISASSVLFDSAINENFGELGEWNGMKTIFKTFNKEIPFDLFGAVFYCISRMEEYGENAVDEHGRYLPSNSVLFKLDILHLPIVDLWLSAFKEVLQRDYPALEFNPPSFQTINTFDIDQAFCYHAKGLKRNIGGLLRDLSRLRLASVTQRILVMAGLQKDPYDTFDYILAQQKLYASESIIFFLMADWGTYDKNIDTAHPDFLKVIKKMQSGFTIGIHPSYASGKKSELIAKEISRLEKTLEKQIAHGRQHYLKFNIPNTYRLLIENDIRHEYSMGYANTPGFRAGTSYPFHWFDIEKNEVTLLEVNPCCLMDVTMKNYLNLSPEAALSMLREYQAVVKQTGGNFICIWHNESVSDYAEWKGWKAVYEAQLA